MASQQQPPYPIQPPQQQQPVMQRPPATNDPRMAPPGYRPVAGNAMPPTGTHPGMPYRPSGTPPPPHTPPAVGAGSASPPIRPGYRPMPVQQQQPSPRMQAAQPQQAGMRPPMASPMPNTMMMRPAGVGNRVMSPPAQSPSQQQAQVLPPPSTGTPPPASQSPTVSAGSSAPQSPVVDHHTRTRKRMYPEQITKAYMDQPATAPVDSFGYPQQQQQQQQHQMSSPVPSMPAYPGAQPPTTSNYPQVNAMAGQFGNMSLGSVSVMLGFFTSLLIFNL